MDRLLPGVVIDICRYNRNIVIPALLTAKLRFSEQ